MKFKQVIALGLLPELVLQLQYCFLGSHVKLMNTQKVTFPVRMMTPTELSSLASLNAIMSSFTVCGPKAFLRSGLFIVIYKRVI